MYQINRNLIDDLKTGDIVLMSRSWEAINFDSLFSPSNLTKMVQKVVLRHKWTHVAMVVVRHNKVLLWESTHGKVRDVDSQEIIKGVQLVDCHERVEHYAGQIAFRRIQLSPETQAELPQKLEKLYQFMEAMRGVPYEKKMLELLRAVYDGPGGMNQEDLSSVFCSELIAATYQKMGFLKSPPQGLPANEYLPYNFSIEFQLPLIGATLGKEVLLKKREAVNKKRHLNRVIEKIEKSV